jgi:TolB-like protein
VIRIAVLPLRVVRPDDETTWLAESLSQAIGDTLTAIGRFTVRPAQIVRLHAGPGKDPSRLCEELGIDYALQGVLARESVEGIRFTCHLTRASAAEPIWSHVFELQWERLHWLEQMIAHRLVHVLRIELAPEEQRRLSRDTPKTESAYESYLRGLHAYEAGSAEKLREGIEHFRRSIQYQPYYALPWARMGLCFRVLEWRGEDSEECAREAQSTYEHALELSPDSPLINKLRNELAPECGRAQDAMLRSLERAARWPAGVDAWIELIKSCRFCGLLGESLDADRKARSLDPKAFTDVARSHFLAGDFGLVASMHNGGSDPYLRAASHAALGHNDEAMRRLQDSEDHKAATPLASLLRLSLLTYLHSGSRKALATLREPLPSYPLDPEGQLLLARHYSQFGDPDAALDRCLRALEQGLVHPRALEDDPWLERLRRHRDFPDLLERHRDAEIANRSAYRSRLDGRYFTTTA